MKTKIKKAVQGLNESQSQLAALYAEFFAGADAIQDNKHYTSTAKMEKLAEYKNGYVPTFQDAADAFQRNLDAVAAAVEDYKLTGSYSEPCCSEIVAVINALGTDTPSEMLDNIANDASEAGYKCVDFVYKTMTHNGFTITKDATIYSAIVAPDQILKNVQTLRDAVYFATHNINNRSSIDTLGDYVRFVNEAVERL